jgi:hypothetical protein
MSALLSYQPTTHYAHAVMSETLCGFGVALGIFGLVAALVFLDDRLLLSGAFVLGTIGSAGAFYTRPAAAGITLVVWLGLAALLYASRAISTRSKLVMSALVLGFVVVVMVIPENRLQQRYGWASLFTAETFFCNHANIVIDVVPRVISDTEAASKLESILDETLKNGPDGWPLLGFNGDSCMWRHRNDLKSILADHYHGQSDVLMSSFVEGVLMHPFTYGTKVARQILAELVEPFPNYKYHWAPPPDESTYHKLTPPSTTRYATYRAWTEFVNLHLSASTVEEEEQMPLELIAPPLYKTGVEILKLLNQTSLVLIAMVTALFMCDAWRLWTGALERRKFFFDWAAFGVFAVTYFAYMLTVALSHTFDIQRYSEGMAPVALIFFFGCAMRSFDWLRFELPQLCASYRLLRPAILQGPEVHSSLPAK